MASSGKKKTTMAKLQREGRLRERRLDKQARKVARKYAAANPVDPLDEASAEDAQALDGEEGIAADGAEGTAADGAPRAEDRASEPGAASHPEPDRDLIRSPPTT